MRGIRTRSISRGSALVAALVVLGSGTMLYPTTAAWFSEYNLSQVNTEYSQASGELDLSDRELAVQQAREYNQTLTGGAIVDPELERASDGTGAVASQYRSMLADDLHGVMARVQIPAIGVDLPIYHGTSEDVLRRGVGHLFGTALPVGGLGTHSVLTGHRGLPESTLFTELDQVEIGDLVQVQVSGETLTYRILETRVVEPTETHSLYPVAGQDLLTLVTCTPLGINSHRILVTAERITPNPLPDDPALAMPLIPGLPWWAVGIASAFAVAAATITLTTRARQGAGVGPRGSASSRRPLEPLREPEPITGIIG